ncbi:MAG: hypothetical protein ACLQIQ_15860 [Beijerinckiaceae bacterium]
MQIDPKTAEASLADIDAIVARLKQSAYYRSASAIIVTWGGLVALGYVATFWAPRQAVLVWVLVNCAGLLATFAYGLRLRGAGAGFDWRIVIAVLLFFGFGLACCRMGHFGARESSAFWPMLFMFGYALAGLWLGRAFTWLGICVALLTFAGYLMIETGLDLYLAVVDGGGMILAGLWTRRA